MFTVVVVQLRDKEPFSHTLTLVEAIIGDRAFVRPASVTGQECKSQIIVVFGSETPFLYA